MIKAIIKSTVRQDGTPEDVTEVRKSIRELLLDSRASTTTKAAELSPSQAQQVLAHVSTLLAELDSNQAATGWAKKAASYKKKVIPYLTEGLLIYISEPTSTILTLQVLKTLVPLLGNTRYKVQILRCWAKVRLRVKKWTRRSLLQWLYTADLLSEPTSTIRTP
jgi:hypothetical protein